MVMWPISWFKAPPCVSLSDEEQAIHTYYIKLSISNRENTYSFTFYDCRRTPCVSACLKFSRSSQAISKFWKIELNLSVRQTHTHTQKFKKDGPTTFQKAQMSWFIIENHWSILRCGRFFTLQKCLEIPFVMTWHSICITLNGTKKVTESRRM